MNVDGHGDILINAINTQGTGTAQINANRIHIQSTSGSGIELDQNGNISLNAGEAVNRINGQSGSGTVYLNAAMIHLNGTGIVSGSGNGLIAPEGWFTDLYAGSGGGQFVVEGSDIRAYAKLYAEGGIDALDGATVAATNGEFTNLTVGNADVANAVDSIGPATASGGQITIPWTRLDGTPGTPINFNIAATQYYIDGVAAAYLDAVGRVAWPSASNQSTFGVSVPVEPWNAATENGTTGSRNFALSAGAFDANHVSTVTLTMSGGGSSVIVAALPVDASGEYTAGQDSVNVVMGSWSGGRVTFSPSVGAGTGKTLELSNISGPNTITANGEYTYTVMYEDASGNDQSTGLTKKITVDTPVSSIQSRRYVTYTSNGTRTVSPSSGYDAMAAVEVTVNVPPPAYSASGWGITSTAGGGTKVELYVDGNHFSHTFDNYP